MFGIFLMSQLVSGILSFVGGLLGGAVGGFFLARYFLTQQIKKNPPINEKMIRAMFLSMGQKPNEARIRQVMQSIEKQK